MFCFWFYDPVTRDYRVVSSRIHCGAVQVWGDTCYKNSSTPSSLAGLLTTSDIQGIAMVDMSVLGQSMEGFPFLPHKIHGFVFFYFSSKYKILYLLEK